MQKIHQNIIVVIFLLFIVPATFLIFTLTWDFFNLGKFTSENIFIERSSCDPAEAEPTYFTIVMVLTVGIFTAYYIGKSLTK